MSKKTLTGLVLVGALCLFNTSLAAPLPAHDADDLAAPAAETCPAPGVFQAEVTHVWNDGCVNLKYTDANGVEQTAGSVPLFRDGDELSRPTLGFYAVLKQDQAPAEVQQADVDEAITGVQYHHFPGTTVTVCLATLWGGQWNVLGQSSATDPARFDPEKGEKYAREDALRQAGRFIALDRVRAAARA